MTDQPKQVLEEMLRLLGFQAAVSESRGEKGSVLDIETDDPGRLIGKRGQTLAQIQYILNRILLKRDPEASPVALDIEAYRDKLRQSLVDRALRAADRARRGQDIVELEPMNAYERKMVHQALKDVEDIESQSVEVEGTSRKAIILRPSA